MQLVKVTKNYQITLPARLRRRLVLKEGDYLATDMRDGAFIFKPASPMKASVFKKASGEEMDPEQEWFWRAAWQKKEREADADISTGRTKSSSSVKDLVAELRVIAAR